MTVIDWLIYYHMCCLLYCLSIVPGPPEIVTALVINATSLLLSWKKPLNPNGEIVGYKVAYYGFVDSGTTEVNYAFFQTII